MMQGPSQWRSSPPFDAHDRVMEGKLVARDAWSCVLCCIEARLQVQEACRMSRGNASILGGIGAKHF